jgi:predicted HD superfamily hydrolase involved in NAD metabolism
MTFPDSDRTGEFMQLLKRRVTPKTYRHCINTGVLLYHMAEAAGITREQAMTAGLLHDLCKKLDNDAFIDTARHYGITPRPTQVIVPKLLHGPIAAEECRRALGIVDESVYEAIYWHTTGRPGLGPVGLALYVADFAEPARDHPEAEEARRLLRESGFRETLRYVVHARHEYIQNREHADPMTGAFYEWLEATHAGGRIR